MSESRITSCLTIVLKDAKERRRMINESLFAERARRASNVVRFLLPGFRGNLLDAVIWSARAYYSLPYPFGEPLVGMI